MVFLPVFVFGVGFFFCFVFVVGFWFFLLFLFFVCFLVLRQNGLSFQGRLSGRICLFLQVCEKEQVKTSMLKFKVCIFVGINEELRFFH